MPLTLFPGTDIYTTVTISGLYDNNTESPLFAANGTAAPTSGILVGSVDTNGNFQPLSSTPNGFLNVNATFSGTTTVEGTLSNNTAAPIADNLGTLGFLAATSYTTNTYTNGFQVLATTDLHGAINDDLQAVAGVQLGATAVVAFGSAPAAVNVPAVNSSIFSGTTALTNTAGALNVNVTNTVPVSITGQPITVKGEYTNNTTATSTITDQFAVLPATAATAYNTFTWTSGNQVVLVTDLHGAINNDMQASAGVQLGATAVTAFGTAPAAANVIGANVSIFAGTTGITATGSSLNVDVTNTVPVTQGTTPWIVAGNLTNNNAAPTTNNVGALVAQALGPFPAAAPSTYTANNEVLLTTSLGGSVINIPADEEFANQISYFSFDNGITTVLTGHVAGTYTPIFSIESNSATVQFLIRALQVTDKSGAVHSVRLIKNGTLTGSTFATTVGNAKIDTAATAITGGTVVLSGYSAAEPFSRENLLQYIAAGAPGDHYTIAAVAFGGAGNVVAALQWSEISASI
jgi:hypothetical protein